MNKIKIGDIVKVKYNADWHESFVNKMFTVAEINDTTLTRYRVILTPYKWTAMNVFIEEEHIKDLVVINSLEIVRDIKPHRLDILPAPDYIVEE